MSNVHVFLVPGFWLGGWAWERVEPVLTREGLTAHPITPAGLSDDHAEATLADQIDALVESVADLSGPLVLVGHSNGGAVVQGVTDRIPDRIRRVVYVDTGPLSDGTPMWHEPIDGGSVPFPTWEELEAFPSTALDGLDRRMLAGLRSRATPQPGGVAGSHVRVTNPKRLEVPATVVCTSILSDEFRRHVEAGTLPTEIETMSDVRFVDLATGHWPMFSRPEDLGRIIADEARRDDRHPIVEFGPVSTISFWADDVDEAADWYTSILGYDPYFRVPGYVEFRIGPERHELGIIDRSYAPTPSADGPGATVYWHVDDVAAATDALVAAGASSREPVTSRGDSGYVTASVLDPFGNVVGLIHNPHKQSAVASPSRASRDITARSR